MQQINQGAEETHRNVEQANTKLDSAIQSAKNARRWKWYALIIISKSLSTFTAHGPVANRCSHYYCDHRRCGCRCHPGQQERQLQQLIVLCTTPGGESRIIPFVFPS